MRNRQNVYRSMRRLVRSGVSCAFVSGGCLDESLVVAFLRGTLLPATRDQAEAHVAACSACADLVTWAAADIAATASRAPGSEGRPFVGALTPGSRVGRYQILGAVGRGGMGEVYAAYHPELDRRIALKVVNESGTSTDERRTRLLREARAIARLSHPNVVAVHDAGTMGDRVFIAMEFVDGHTVDKWLQAAPRTWQQVLDVFVAAGRGLAAAHTAGIVHRDFKPQNVMIGKDGVVRVMDFGLARLLNEDSGVAHEGGIVDRPPPTGIVTKTGALLGTPAYMSPEQARGGAVDARSDQYSFCVALREALVIAPSWLRTIVFQGTAANRDQRYDSMAELLAALARGRTRLRRRAVGAVAALAITLIASAGWRLARGEGIVCSIPKDRVGSAWANDDVTHPRRQTIRKAFLASGRQSVETIWQRLSSMLDEHMRAWSSMYVQTCEATHVRGEQSAEVLDLRMSCLGDNLDQVRALTDTLATADAEVVSRAVSAAKDLTPVARCADVALLRSAVPLPRDERTLREVQRLRQSIADIEALRGVGRIRIALAKAIALRPEVDATNYRPLLGELLEVTGSAKVSVDANDAEATLESAVFEAEAAHDDGTAAKAATGLIFVVGMGRGRQREAERWWRWSIALLDRLGNGHTRTRAWALNNYGIVLASEGKLEQAKVLLEEAVRLKEQALGPDHFDVAISLDGLNGVLLQLRRPHEALVAVNRGFAIMNDDGDLDGSMTVSALNGRGEAMRLLGDTVRARAEFEKALTVLVREKIGPENRFFAEATAGIGRVELDEGRPASAIPRLESALQTLEHNSATSSVFASDFRFALARALWDSGVDRRRAISLAMHARDLFTKTGRADRARETEHWLSSHHARQMRPETLTEAMRER